MICISMRLIYIILYRSDILATATVSFYTIKSDTEAIVFKQSGYKSIQHYTSEFLEPSRWCRHLIDPFNADFTVKFLFRPEILCEYPVGGKFLDSNLVSVTRFNHLTAFKKNPNSRRSKLETVIARLVGKTTTEVTRMMSST